MIEAILVIAGGLCLLSGLMISTNVFLFRPAVRYVRKTMNPKISVLIPARNEADTIGECIESILRNRDVGFEIIVMDDGSTDATASIVTELMRRDSRVILQRAPGLPSGWVGKCHACYRLAHTAKHSVIVFLDADVRLAPDALMRVLATMEHQDADLLSGFPYQVTESLGEKLIIPLIHFLLLGYLPIMFMRKSTYPALGAACGQLIAVRKDAYWQAGGHRAICDRLHDGLALSRLFRRHGFRTDIFDATDTAYCRMYRNWREVWGGFSKNATEGMASPTALPIWTLLLAGGHLLPPILFLLFLWQGNTDAMLVAMIISGLSLAQRFMLTLRFKQSYLGAALHWVGIGSLLAIQWHALIRESHGRPREWKGRRYLPGNDHTAM